MDRRVREACEREANQAAIELLPQGDRLREMSGDAEFGSGTVKALANVADISLPATSRRLAEGSRRLCAAVTYYKGGGRLMPAHVYPSAGFEERFRWQAAAHRTQPYARRCGPRRSPARARS